MLTLHPVGKSGVNIDRVKCDQIKAAIHESLNEMDSIGFSELKKVIQVKLEGNFMGSISWYYTTV
ncbi:MAG: DUF6958 family protein [Candidatus Thorarchaeota archaeon]